MGEGRRVPFIGCRFHCRNTRKPFLVLTEDKRNLAHARMGFDCIQCTSERASDLDSISHFHFAHCGRKLSLNISASASYRSTCEDCPPVNNLRHAGLWNSLSCGLRPCCCRSSGGYCYYTFYTNGTLYFSQW